MRRASRRQRRGRQVELQRRDLPATPARFARVIRRFGSGALGLAFVLLLPGCDGCGKDEAIAEDPTSSQASESGGEEPAQTPAGPPPVLRLTGEPAADGSVALVVQSRGSESAKLAPTVIVERAREGSWQVVSDPALTLRFDCGSAPAECLELVPGAELRPPSWLGTSEASEPAQCACDGCASAPAGRYRFVVESCAGHRVEGEPFTVE